MSDATKSPSDDEKEKKRNQKGETHSLSAVSLITIRCGHCPFLPFSRRSLSSCLTQVVLPEGSNPTGQQTAIESPASTNADKDDGSQKDALHARLDDYL